MILFPAIDLFEGKAVRLLRGDYRQMTVYSDDPASVAAEFAAKGASAVHIVDLEGARSGGTPNFDTVLKIKRECGLFCEIGGGIRSAETLERYADAEIDRMILGTAAVTDPGFLAGAVSRFGDRIAVGVDIADGYAAIRGWTEKSSVGGEEMVKRMSDAGVGTVIVTDISKDGAMKGTNRKLYRRLAGIGPRITASGGVSTLDDVRALRDCGVYGAIVGKAIYTGAIDLCSALEAAK